MFTRPSWIAAALLITASCADPTRPTTATVDSFVTAESSAKPSGRPVRLAFPDPDPGPPFYSELSPDLIVHTDEQAAIVFWRSPECVPPDFNLLDFLDFTPAFPGGPPRVFVCPLTVEGVQTWHDPATDPFPYQADVHGTGAVPIWFVAWPELQSALADGVVTISELVSLLSLRIGVATFYRESVRNSGQGARHPSSTTVARGTTLDGGDFRLHVTEKLQDGERHLLAVQIVIGESQPADTAGQAAGF